MALIPQNSDAFLREVDDEVRRDRAAALVRRWGRAVALAIGVGLLLLGGWLAWRARDARLAAADSVTLAPSIDDLAQSRPVTDAAGLARVAQSRRAGFRAAAMLAQAASAAQKGAVAEAGSRYAAIAADTGLPGPVRDLATVRGAAIQFDTLPPAQVIDRLKGLAVVGNPWFGSAGELTALALVKLGKRDRAGQLFAAIARDVSVPTVLRGRAAGMATALGQPVPASAQTIAKE